MIRILTAGISASTLLACSGGGSTGDAGPTVSPIVGALSQSRNTPILSVTPSALDGAYVLNQGAGNTLLIGNPALDSGAFDAAGTASEEMVFRAETDDSRVTLTRDIMDATGVTFERLNPTALPMGTMDYDGDYVAIVSNVDNGNVVYLINGVAGLDVNFGMGTVSGSITDRVVLGPSGDAAIGVTAADITLSNGTFTGLGVFSGETSGGSISALSTTTAQAGTFDGLIAGAEGDEAVGGLDFIHDRTGADYLEEGAFIVTESELILAPLP